jgi:ketosteroid isomerase-like protein
LPKCPNCGAEIEEEDSYCKRCGTKLTDPAGPDQDQTSAGSSLEDEIKSTLVRRFDAIKNRDEGAVRALVDESYSKFDDWPPFRRQKTTEALENEFGAFKVLSNYSYELKDFEANVLGDVAIATFTIHYQGTMRNRLFDVTSRVTSVLKKQDSGWKVVHEHYSRFPGEAQQQRFIQPRRFPF